MDIYTSLDGVHWNLVHDGASETWTYDTSKTVDENVKIVDLTGNAARYVKLVVKNSVGGFFAANELAIYKKDGTSAFAVGSHNFLAEIKAADYTNMKNYRGTCTKDGSNFVDQIQKRYADINYNNVYDVYDYAFTAFPQDGGTRKRGNVSGNASYDVTVEGENLVIKVMAKSVKNVNAFGQVLNYDPGKLEFVSVTPGDMILDMETEFAVNKLYDDGTAYVNLAYFNKGDKELVKGSGVLATIVMKGTDAEAIDLSSLMLIGPDYSLLTINTGAGAESAPVVTYYSQDDVTLTMTNSVLKSDDGSNVTKIIQQKTYDGLFNGTQGRDFEFMWDVESNYVDGELPAEVTLPLTMNIAFKEAAKLTQVNVYNANKANGYITKAEAVINYADGTKGDKLVIELGVDERADYAAFDFVWKAEGKLVESVDITFVEAVKKDDSAVTNMLTLAEMELKYSETATPTPAPETPEPPVVEVNKAALNAAIAKAEALKADDYTAESWAAVEELLTYAKNIAKTDTISQAEVDLAAEELTAAIEALKEKEDEPVDPPAVEEDEVVRLFGDGRYDTAYAVADELKEVLGVEKFEAVVVATGKTFADSLSASAAKLPILLVKPESTLNDAQKAVLTGMKNIYIVGGDGAVSASYEAELAAFGDVTRVFGDSRYDTSVEVAKTFCSDVDKAVVASGKNFPDGLCGGPLAAALNAPLILTKDGSAGAEAAYVAENGIAGGYVLGGDGALANDTVVEVFALESAAEIK